MAAASHSTSWCGYLSAAGAPRASARIRDRHSASRRLTSGPAAGNAAMTTLVSFDVDGTLIHSTGPRANRLHKEAFSAAFAAVFGIDTNIDVVQHHGSTDPLILIKVLQHHGVAKQEAMQRLPDLQEAMVRHFTSNAALAGDGLEVLPGIVDLLAALQARGDVAVCLVTGNLQPIGWTKMEALGIKHLFSEPWFGGFGSDFCSGNVDESWRDRAQLVRIAAQRAEQHFPGGIVRRFHVGDAPMDVMAAEDAGAKAIGVSTGIYSAEELRRASGNGAPVLDGLADLPRVLRELQLA